jgi:hypothetical protein
LVIAWAILSGGQLAVGQSQSSASSRSPHGSLSIPCQNCHTLSGWKPIRAVPEFDHNTTKYPLRGMHEGVSCTQCHTKMVFTNVGKQCADCHADLHKGQMGANCEQCHNVKGWHVAVQQINQHLNRFPLIGAHATLDCDACHRSAAVGQFQGLSTACVSCHQQDFINTKAAGIDHVALKLPTTCEQCHSMDNWMGAKFDHLQFTGFALTGAHATLDCNACHIGGKFAGTPATCVGCHLADFNKTNNPPHATANFPTTCQTCHNTTAWDPATFDHNTFTKFPLTGGHVGVACNLCHINGQFVGTPTDCASCHMKDFNGTTNPNHVTSGFPTTCQQCHTTASWTAAAFDHSTTGFTLTGAHVALQCNQCHNTAFSPSGAYNLTTATCITCHQKDYQGTNAPPHQSANISTSCEQCHTTTNWNGANFDHTSTGFTLTGAHTTLTCTQCHNTQFSPSGAYSLTSTACITCHQADFNGTTSPPHVSSGISQTCQNCHNTTNWGNGTFDHSTTGFTLTGAHIALQCAQCHNTTFSPGGAYNLTSTACSTCHMTDYNGTTNPPHASSGISQNCQQCHTTTNWGNGTFDHSTTGFALTGFHTTMACTGCHNTTLSPSGAYNLTSANTTCISCHMTDFQGTTNPNHVQSNFPQTCQQCHSTTSWGGATFDHTTTGFALTGFHTTMACTGCHNTTLSPSGAYNLTSGTCITCHQTDYNNTNAPPHAQAGFSTGCQQCHSTTDWTGATFDHTTTGFTLTGFHTTVACTGCHNTTYSPSGAYNLKSAACVTCHQTDYNGTTNPNHQSAGFPTTCDQCHSTTNWGSGTFNHTSTGFTLTGFHSTMACTGCHNTTISPGGAYSLTSASTTCITCHQTDYNNTNAPPHATSGFPTTCDTCHSTTDWTGASFNHNNTTFPLTGYHATSAVTCVMCHVNNNYTTLPTTCVGCHQTDYNNTTNPNHASAGFPTTCATCHTTTAWTGATFNHTYFPTNHGNANGVCATCHTNPSDYSVFQCTGCHGNNNAANFGHPNVGGYVYNSVNCYQCHKNGGGG